MSVSAETQARALRRYYTRGAHGVPVLRTRWWRPGLRDYDAVDQAMNMGVGAAWSKMAGQQAERLDLAHLQQIHRGLFRKVVPWAGEIRVRGYEVTAGRTGIDYLDSDKVERGLKQLFHRLQQQNQLRGLSADEFAVGAAGFWGRLSELHPFVDGNTRAQSAFMDQLARQAGYHIAWSKIDVQQLRMARLAWVDPGRRDIRPLARLIRDSISPLQPGQNSEFLQAARIARSTMKPSRIVATGDSNSRSAAISPVRTAKRQSNISGRPL